MAKKLCLPCQSLIENAKRVLTIHPSLFVDNRFAIACIIASYDKLHIVENITPVIYYTCVTLFYVTKSFYPQRLLFGFGKNYSDTVLTSYVLSIHL